MIRVPTIYEINDLRFHNRALYREMLKHKTWAYDDFIQDISGFDRDEIDQPRYANLWLVSDLPIDGFEKYGDIYWSVSPIQSTHKGRLLMTKKECMCTMSAMNDMPVDDVLQKIQKIDKLNRAIKNQISC